MSANLNSKDGKVAMFSYGEEPWHKLGQRVDHALTAEEAIKAAQLREMTPHELQEQLEKDRQELFNLRFQAATQQLGNPRRMREVRKNIARILTILQERQAA